MNLEPPARIPLTEQVRHLTAFNRELSDKVRLLESYTRRMRNEIAHLKKQLSLRKR